VFCRGCSQSSPSSAAVEEVSAESSCVNVVAESESCLSDPTAVSDTKAKTVSDDTWINCTEPNQPMDKQFDSIVIQGHARRFNSKYFKEFSWLDWNEQQQKVYCFPCRKIRQSDASLLYKSHEPSFVDTGFCNWHDVSRKLKKHDQSDSHRECMEKWASMQKGASVFAQLSEQYSQEQANSRTALSTIITSLQFLAKQGLAVQGNENDDGNFKQLLHLRSQEVSFLRSWMGNKVTWTSHDIQNELLTTMSHAVLRKLICDIKHAKFFGLMADEVTDSAGLQQMGVSLRWVDNNFFVLEDFIGLYELKVADASALTSLLEDVLIRCDISLDDCRGVCFDGASVMSGCNSGVAMQLVQKNHKAVFIHCMAHSLSLAVQDSIRNLPNFRNHLDVAKDIIQLIRASPKRRGIFAQVQTERGESNPRNLRPLCPTRWAIRANSLNSILQNYAAVL